MKKIALIGAGNLARSLLQGLLRISDPLRNLYIFDINPKQSKQVGSKYPTISICSRAADAVASAEVVLLCVKPNDIRSVCKEICSVLDGRLLVSVAAGVRLEMIQKWTSSTIVIRCMPNLPIAVGQGMSVLCAAEGVLPAQRAATEEIFAAVGEVAWLTDETLMEQVTALSGSGPAYFFYFLQTLQDAVMASGMTHDLAKRLVVQTALGAAAYARESTVNLSELCDRVTSKGGTTEQALAIFEQENLPAIFKRALQAATERCTQIANEVSLANEVSRSHSTNRADRGF